MVWISIEGSIGSGKTTVVNKLNEEYFHKDVGIFREPIEEWGPYLELFYNNKKRYAFLSQVRINTSFLNIYNKVQKTDTAITERSSFSAKHIFGKMLYDKDIMTDKEYYLCNELIDLTQHKIPDYFIYLKTDPFISYNRIIERGDKPIDINYLQNLSNYHDKTFSSSDRVYVVDNTNLSKNDTFKEVVNIIRTIKSK